jgi:hypothetical protein
MIVSPARIAICARTWRGYWKEELATIEKLLNLALLL